MQLLGEAWLCPSVCLYCIGIFRQQLLCVPFANIVLGCSLESLCWAAMDEVSSNRWVVRDYREKFGLLLHFFAGSNPQHLMLVDICLELVLFWSLLVTLV